MSKIHHNESPQLSFCHENAGSMYLKRGTKGSLWLQIRHNRQQGIARSRHARRCCLNGMPAMPLAMPLAVVAHLSQFAQRTALTRARKGGLAQLSSDQLLCSILTEGLNRSGIPPGLVEDIVVGGFSNIRCGLELTALPQVPATPRRHATRRGRQLLPRDFQSQLRSKLSIVSADPD
jgi:hypothetical protein